MLRASIEFALLLRWSYYLDFLLFHHWLLTKKMSIHQNNHSLREKHIWFSHDHLIIRMTTSAHPQPIIET